MKGRGLVEFFFYGPSPLCVRARACVWGHLFIGGKVLSSSLNCLVQHLYFDLFFLKSNINVDLIRKINDFENDMLKAECVEKTFEI
jgi:hypothetical protein